MARKRSNGDAASQPAAKKPTTGQPSRADGMRAMFGPSRADGSSAGHTAPAASPDEAVLKKEQDDASSSGAGVAEVGGEPAMLPSEATQGGPTSFVQQLLNLVETDPTSVVPSCIAPPAPAELGMLAPAPAPSCIAPPAPAELAPSSAPPASGKAEVLPEELTSMLAEFKKLIPAAEPSGTDTESAEEQLFK